MGMDTIQPIELSRATGALSKRPYVPQEALTCGQKVKRWFKKYFLEGQHLEEEAEAELQKLPENPTWEDLIFIKYRKFVAMLIPFTLMQVPLFPDRDFYLQETSKCFLRLFGGWLLFDTTFFNGIRTTGICPLR
ncbi:unnamed protein product [Haemonchus placei]|uniref:Homeobox domain-containing protein n=1 Tax=Haemonchus placei TaxID=6290 RepID=A0A0N4VXL3_HAEPC|nr:unnamed protein product [Haemonchus placei]